MSGQLDLKRVGARPLEPQFPHQFHRSGSHLARVGRTSPMRFRVRPISGLGDGGENWPKLLKPILLDLPLQHQVAERDLARDEGVGQAKTGVEVDHTDPSR
jgi:hypothetical protein